MQRNWQFAIVTVILIVSFSGCLLQEASAWQLVDHTMCKDIDTNAGQPISRTTSFTPTDAAAYCWFSLDIRDVSAATSVTITRMWYNPSNTLYTTGTQSLQGGTSWYAWASIYIKDYPPATNLGTWHIDVYASGGPFQNTKLFTETFTITQQAALNLLDHTMCKDVDNNDQPISRTSTFATTDAEAICWLYVDATTVTGTVTLTYNWYDPSNSLFGQPTDTFTGGTPQRHWMGMYIKDHTAATKPGTWHVDVYATGGTFQNVKLFSETFTIIQQTYSVTISTAGLPSTLSANIWVDNQLSGTIAGGASKTFNLTPDTSHKFAIDAYVNTTTGTRYYCSTNIWATSSASSHTFSYQTQYYLIVKFWYDGQVYVIAGNWFDAGSTVPLQVNSPIDHGNGTRHVFVGWSGDLTANTPTTSLVITGPSTVTVTWKKQYYLTVTSPYGSPKGSAWYDEKTTAQFEIVAFIDHENNTRHAFKSWSGDSTATTSAASIIIDAPKTVKATWKTQYQLILPSVYGTLTGGGWYDTGYTATFSITQTTVDQGNGTRRLFVSWTGDSTATTPTTSIVLTGPKTITPIWKKQYQLTVNSAFGLTTGSGWYDADTVATFSVPPSYPMQDFMGTLGGKYVFQTWSIDSTAPTSTAPITMNVPKTVTAIWTTDMTMPYAIIGGIIAVIVAAVVITVRKMGKKPKVTPPSTVPSPPPSPPAVSQEARYCIHCGTEISTASTYCRNCGKKQ